MSGIESAKARTPSDCVQRMSDRSPLSLSRAKIQGDRLKIRSRGDHSFSITAQVCVNRMSSGLGIPQLRTLVSFVLDRHNVSVQSGDAYDASTTEWSRAYPVAAVVLPQQLTIASIQCIEHSISRTNINSIAGDHGVLKTAVGYVNQLMRPLSSSGVFRWPLRAHGSSPHCHRRKACR